MFQEEVKYCWFACELRDALTQLQPTNLSLIFACNVFMQ